MNICELCNQKITKDSVRIVDDAGAKRTICSKCFWNMGDIVNKIKCNTSIHNEDFNNAILNEIEPILDADKPKKYNKKKSSKNTWYESIDDLINSTNKKYYVKKRY